MIIKKYVFKVKVMHYSQEEKKTILVTPHKIAGNYIVMILMGGGERG